MSVSIQGSPGFIIEKEKRADSHNSILSYNQRFHLFFWPFLQLEGHMLDWKTETNQLIIKEQAIQLPSKLISFMHTWTISDFSPELFFQLSDIQIETLNRISKIVIQKYFPKNKSIHTL
ncbi:MAG: hypothetical protein U9Q15_02670 [Patescibacteria group bacterium]|nr:hypothetical protein [Patescibacteria group bacterium]